MRPDTSRQTKIPLELWGLSGLLLLAAIVRFATISSQSYWVDEANTAHEVQLPFFSMLDHVGGAGEATPPLYFGLAWVWVRIFGAGALGLRSLSAIAGVAVVAIAYLCGKELISKRAGLLAAAFTALCPFMIWYSQEARAYMLLAALTGASFLCFVRAWKEPTPRRLAWWAGVSALALLTHFFAGFLVAPEALMLLWRARSRPAAIAVAAIAVVEAALIPLAVSDSSNIPNWIAGIPLSLRIKQIPVEFGLSTLYKSSLLVHGLLIAGILGAWVAALLALGGSSEHRRAAGLAAAVAAFVVLVPIGMAEVGHDYVVTRELMPAWIPLALLVAIACVAPRTWFAGAGLAASLLFAFGWGWIRIQDNPVYQRPNWKGVAAALGDATTPRAIVAADGGAAATPLEVYLPHARWDQPGRVSMEVGELDAVGSSFATPSRTLPTGVRLIGSKVVDDFVVARFLLVQPARMSTAQLGALGGSLIDSHLPVPAVLYQNPK